MTELIFEHYVRTPFAVEATVITKENIEEVAKLVGTVRTKKGETKNDEPYIALDRRIVPNISRAFIGWYVTRLGDNLRCYSPKVFSEQFQHMSDTKVVCFDFNESDDDGFSPATEENWEATKEVVAEQYEDQNGWE
jgi:hypothetical protein